IAASPSMEFARHSSRPFRSSTAPPRCPPSCTPHPGREAATSTMAGDREVSPGVGTFGMRHKIGLAVASLHISALLYLLVGLMFPVFLADDEHGLPFAVCMLIFCLALVAGIEVVVYGLHRRRFWAWVAGLSIFGMYLPSLFFPLGALGLW